jgi:hypothetical protein
MQELVAETVREIFTADTHGAFRIVSSRAQPGDYVQWVGNSDEGFWVEISDPGRNEIPARPLTPDQLATIAQFGFREEPSSNFARAFPFTEESLPDVVNVITEALAEVFGLTEAQQVEVTRDEG